MQLNTNEKKAAGCVAKIASCLRKIELRLSTGVFIRNTLIGKTRLRILQKIGS